MSEVKRAVTVRRVAGGRTVVSVKVSNGPHSVSSQQPAEWSKLKEAVVTAERQATEGLSVVLAALDA